MNRNSFDFDRDVHSFVDQDDNFALENALMLPFSSYLSMDDLPPGFCYFLRDPMFSTQNCWQHLRREERRGREMSLAWRATEFPFFFKAIIILLLYFRTFKWPTH